MCGEPAAVRLRERAAPLPLRSRRVQAGLGAVRPGAVARPGGRRARRPCTWAARSARSPAGEAAVAAGSYPERPFVLAVQPCAADPSRAPAGRHVLWAYCHVPNGSTADMTAAIEDQVERFAPGFRDLVIARAAHGPAALEEHNAEPGRRRHRRRLLAASPSSSAARCCRPGPGGRRCPASTCAPASTPPGAGVHGMGGYHAARLALAELGHAASARVVGRP